MEKENIRPIDIKDFKDSQHTLDYIDNDFAIVNSLEGIPDNNDIVRLECFIIAVCIEGCIQLDINYLPVEGRRSIARPSQYRHQPYDVKP